MKIFMAAAMLSLALVVPAWADPSGTYAVAGTNPDASAYTGSVVLTKTGDTFKVVWTIGSNTVTGTAVGNDDILSIGYATGTQPGVGLFVKESGKWTGVWSYLGQEAVGSETWTSK